MRITRVTTKTGDKGKTRLADGQSVSKASLRVQAYGDVDELNACLGLILADDILARTRDILTPVQHQLFVMGGELAFAPNAVENHSIDRISKTRVESLDTAIQSGRADGMISLDADLRRLVGECRITLETARSFASDPEEFGGTK